MRERCPRWCRVRHPCHIRYVLKAALAYVINTKTLDLLSRGFFDKVFEFLELGKDFVLMLHQVPEGATLYEFHVIAISAVCDVDRCDFLTSEWMSSRRFS